MDSLDSSKVDVSSSDVVLGFVGSRGSNLVDVCILRRVEGENSEFRYAGCSVAVVEENIGVIFVGDKEI